MKKSLLFLLGLFSIAPLNAPLYAQSPAEKTVEKPVDPLIAALNQIIKEQRQASTGKSEFDWLFVPRCEVKEAILGADGTLEIVFNETTGQRKWDAESIQQLKDVLLTELQKALPNSTINQLKLGIAYDLTANYKVYPIEEWATNAAQVRARQQGIANPVPPLSKPVVQTPDYPGPDRSQGLLNKNFVISASHGWTWHFENRWQFQRARVYTIVEDLFPQSSTNPFLIPMLENAGANVWSTRERSYQTAEVIVDNSDNSRDHEFQETGPWSLYEYKGWKGGRPAVLTERDEPFKMGTALSIDLTDETSGTLRYTPFIPRSGTYPVYASWIQSASNSDSVPFKINHAGGQTTVRVNQKVAGSTWVYLGDFAFQKGKSPELGSVEITTVGAEKNAQGPTRVSADAIRFGGGMGNIAVEDQISGKPRYAEAAKYYLQYAGAPYDIVTNKPAGEGHFGGDYNQDITTRGEYANWLQGNPNGPNGFRSHPGLGVPVDAMVSWHTDAGGEADGIVGTLMLYQLLDDENDETFPDGRSRWLNRDLSVYIMDEYIRTIRSEFSSNWPRRDLREVGFGEIRRPNTPSVIIELLSHHNFNDMKYGTDPRFKKATARSVYKALARFAADSAGTQAIIQPLEPLGVSLLHIENGEFQMTILPQSDPLEPTAEPTHYLVYRSKDGVAFDNGTAYNSPQFSLTIPDGETHYFRVTAANGGGQSLPSSIVGGSYYSKLGMNRVLVVDGFDRISGAEIVEMPGAQGFDRIADPGVGYHYNYGLVGNQYDFNFNSEWKNDLETPGRGASTSEMENRLEMGNQFNHIVAYGQMLAKQNIPFDSATRLLATNHDLRNQSAIIWIGGEQKTVPPFKEAPDMIEGNPDRMENEFPLISAEQASVLNQYLSSGGKLLISGSHVAQELLGKASTEESRELAGTLGLQGFSSKATTINSVVPALKTGHFEPSTPARFGHDLSPEINIEQTVYPIENAEAFTHQGEVIINYGDSERSAGFITENAAVFGFPLETVLPQSERETLVLGSLNTLFGLPVPEKIPENASKP